MRGFAIGDLHLGKSNLRAMFEDPDSMILGAVETIFNRALQAGVRFVVLLGDIADTQVLPDGTRSAFIRLLHKFDGRLDIRILLGNHDVAETAVHSLHSLETLCKLGMFKTVRVFTDHQVEEYDGVMLEYLAWPAEIPKHKNSVCFGHFEVAGCTRDNGRVSKEGHDQTFESTNFFVQGHLHTPHSVRNHWYTGTFAQMSFGERLPKGYGEFKARVVGKRLEFKKRHVQWQPPWSLYNVVLNSKADVKSYAKLKSEFGPNARVKLYVAEGLKLSEDFLMRNTEIVNRLDFGSEKELAEIQAEELDLETQSVYTDHTELLPAQLKALGASRAQIKRGLQIIGGMK